MLQFLSMIHWESVLVYSHTVRWLEWPRHECQSSKLLFCLFLRFFYVLFLPLAGRTCQATSIHVNLQLRSWEVETCFSRELLASAPSSLQALACSANLPPPSMLKRRQDCVHTRFDTYSPCRHVYHLSCVMSWCRSHSDLHAFAR